MSQKSFTGVHQFLRLTPFSFTKKYTIWMARDLRHEVPTETHTQIYLFLLYRIFYIHISLTNTSESERQTSARGVRFVFNRLPNCWINTHKSTQRRQYLCVCVLGRAKISVKEVDNEIKRKTFFLTITKRRVWKNKFKSSFSIFCSLQLLLEVNVMIYFILCVWWGFSHFLIVVLCFFFRFQMRIFFVTQFKVVYCSRVTLFPGFKLK